MSFKYLVSVSGWLPNERLSPPADMCVHIYNWNIVACDVKHQYTHPPFPYMEVVGSLICMAKFPRAAHGQQSGQLSVCFSVWVLTKLRKAFLEECFSTRGSTQTQPAGPHADDFNEVKKGLPWGLRLQKGEVNIFHTLFSRTYVGTLTDAEINVYEKQCFMQAQITKIGKI